MLGQRRRRLRRWHNIEPALAYRLDIDELYT